MNFGLGYSPITFALEPTPLSEQDCSSQFASCSCTKDECVPNFESKISTLTEKRIAELKKGAWQEGCPVQLSDVRSLSLLYVNEDGRVHKGELVVAKQVVKDVTSIFKRLYESRFVIHKMQSIEIYDGNDDRSMADNNTSALNCRNVKGTKRWSQHSYGIAIDINPLWNPYVRRGKVEPLEGKNFLNREADLPGLIHHDDAIVQWFLDAGWGWGGHWKNSKDYQHFSANGR